MVAMSESATRVIAVEERTLKVDLRTNQLLANGGCDRASIRMNANHPLEAACGEKRAGKRSAPEEEANGISTRSSRERSDYPGVPHGRGSALRRMMMSLPAVCKA
jgi:hypothetical protein